MKVAFICGGVGESELGTDVMSMARAFSQATKNLGERATYWVVLRQQRFLQKLSKKSRDNLYSSTTFYCPLISEDEKNDPTIEDGRSPTTSPVRRNPRRPRLKAASVKRKRRCRRNKRYLQLKSDLERLISESSATSEESQAPDGDLNYLSFLVQNNVLSASDDDNNNGNYLNNVSKMLPLYAALQTPAVQLCNSCCNGFCNRENTKTTKSNFRKRRLLMRKVSSTPVVPPRTRSAQHQQPQNTFNPTFRNQVLPHRPVNSTKVPKNQDTAVKGVGNSSLSLITPTPQPLINQQRQHLAKKSQLPVVSSTLNTTPQPQSLHKPNNNFIHSKYTPLSSSFPKAVQLPQSGHPIGPPPGPPPSIPKANVSSNTQHDIESPSLSGSGSSLPQPPKTLNLGDGKFVRMNNLYESLLKQPYFHPVVRNVLHKLLTKDCMFLVRPSTHSQHPLTLSLQARGKIFNISIRVRNDAKFALGTEKIGEMAFSSVGEIIEFFRDEPIKLEDGSKTYLKWTPPKEGDYIQPE